MHKPFLNCVDLGLNMHKPYLNNIDLGLYHTKTMIIPCMNIDTYVIRVGDGTVIVIYIDGSFIKSKIALHHCSETNLHHSAQSKLCRVR